MIRIRIVRNAATHITGLQARGHARFAAHGQDIVCAAVSALLQTAWLGLETIEGIEVSYRRDDGHLSFALESGAEREGVRVLLSSICLGIRQIEEQYPEFVRVEEKRPRSRNGGRDEGTPARAPRRSAASSSQKRHSPSTVQEAFHE